MSRNDELYAQVFARLKEAMETCDASKWVLPWKALEAGSPISLRSGLSYKGINAFILAFMREMKGFGSRTWATFNQIKELGGSVRRGAKGTLVFFYEPRMIKRLNERGEEEERSIPIARTFIVFNLDQCWGIQDPHASLPDLGPKLDPFEEGEAVVAAYKDGPTIHHGGIKAFYRPSDDSVHVPDMMTFRSIGGYWGVLFHELCHSTGHAKRLGRPGIVDSHAFGDHEYSGEELVAEIGSSMLLGEVGLLSDPEIRTSAEYIKGWWQKLEKDPGMLCRAASQAQKGVDCILGAELES